MSERVLWKGNIRFGPVAVPVKLYPAVKEKQIRFHLLHRRDRVKLKRQMVCAYEGVPVPPEDQARGYELEQGKYILVDPAELERAGPEAGREIEVHEFVAATEIDPVFLEHAYYLGPDEQASGYSALVATLQEMSLAGVCTWTMRKRSYVGSLQAGGTLLRLNTLRYADEVIATATQALEPASLSARELKVGSELVDHLTGRFQPEKFENQHEQKLRELIERKARGEKIVVRPARRLKPTRPSELLRTLQASLKRVA